MVRSFHLTGFLSALLLGTAIPGAAMAHDYPQNTNCGLLEGTAHLACIKQIDHMQSSGAHPAPSVPEASISAASTPGARAGTKGADTSVAAAGQHE